MNGQPDSTTLAFHPKSFDFINRPAACHEYAGCIEPVGYATATVHVTLAPQQPRTAYQLQVPQDSSLVAEEHHDQLCDSCTLTSSASKSSLLHDSEDSPRDHTINKGDLFRPIDFDSLQGPGSSNISVIDAEHAEPKPPSPSAGSLEHASGDPASNEGQSESPMVQVPRNPFPPPVNVEEKGNDDRPRSAPNLPVGIGESHGITVTLSEYEQDLWTKFRREGNEMVLTRQGRRLFPLVVITIRGLDLDAEYTISLRVTQADPYRYQYRNQEWKKNGVSDARQYPRRQIYCHPHSPNTGEFWMKKPISFKHAKVTNETSYSNPTLLLLNSLHKYKVEIVVQEAGREPITIPISGTEFIAVTAYMNPRITNLKIQYNDFAKGFRDEYKRNAVEIRHSPPPLPPTLTLSSYFVPPPCQSPLWHQMPVAHPIPSVPVNRGDVIHSQSALCPYFSPFNNWLLSTYHDLHS